MNKVINLQKRKLEMAERIELSDEPCGLCPIHKKSKCKQTCNDASIWWEVFAKRFGEGSL
jgi:hypothetical protein